MKTLKDSLAFVRLLMLSPMSSARRLVFLLVLLATVWPRPAMALTEFYLDPDYTGTHSGTQSQPFSTLDASAWSTINTALATDNVTLYCSARNAGADTNQVWGVNVDVTRKTANPSFTLTFDGRSKYNTNDSAPSWTAYSGSSKCKVLSFDAQNSAHTKYNKVTIDGFVVAQSGGAKGIAICGDNWTIKNSDISHTATASNGPLVLIVPTADSLNAGSSAWCNRSSNITIQDNVIHDSYGELIYVGAAGCASNDSTLSATNCQGMPSHSNITIDHNTMFNCGSRSSQGDCDDLKAALTNVTISRNDITGNGTAGDASRCIVTQGIQTDGTSQNYVIERNKIHDCVHNDDASVAIVDSWGTPNGIEIRNNIFANNSPNACLKVYTSQASPGITVYNNTFYGCAAQAINTNSGTTILVKNNAMLANNRGGAQTAMSGTVTSDHNGFGSTWGGTCTTCVSGLTSAAFTNVAAEDFTLTSISVLVEQGTAIASFSNDYAGTARPQGTAWAIGAYEFGVPSSPPNPPTTLSVR